jgi:hypothetical protein
MYTWRAVGAIPFVMVLIGVIFFNRVTPFIFGVPLLLAWLLGCMVLTAAVMALIFVNDPSNRHPPAGEEGTP